jgi:hypothetical protein
MMPIDLKIEQAARIYQLTKGNDKEKALFDKDMKVRTGNTRRKQA